MPLTDEQKLRMEENRRKAMEKRQQANQAEPTISNETKSLNVTEQKLRMEENRRKALEIRLQREKDKFINQNSSSINQNDQAITVVENKPAMSTGMSTTSFYDSEKKRRMEENRRKALEIRQQKLLQENSQLNQTQSTSADAPKKLSESEQKMRMEENRLKALKRREEREQQASITQNSNTQTKVEVPATPG